MSDLERAIIDAARKIERGCDCDYDYRCGRCEAVLCLQEALTALDEHVVSELMRLNAPTPTASTKLLPRKAP